VFGRLRKLNCIENSVEQNWMALLNAELLNVFNRISSTVEANKVYLLSASGVTEKTYLIHFLLTKVRSETSRIVDLWTTVPRRSFLFVLPIYTQSPTRAMPVCGQLRCNTYMYICIQFLYRQLLQWFPKRRAYTY